MSYGSALFFITLFRKPSDLYSKRISLSSSWIWVQIFPFLLIIQLTPIHQCLALNL